MLASSMLVAAGSAYADDATWVGGTPANDYTDPANWVGAGARPPDGTATFNTSVNNTITNNATT